MIIMCVYLCAFSAVAAVEGKGKGHQSKSLFHTLRRRACLNTASAQVCVCVCFISECHIPTAINCMLCVCVHLSVWLVWGRESVQLSVTYFCARVLVYMYQSTVCVLQEIGWWWLLWVCPWIHACNPFIPTAAVLSGDRKETAENKRLTHDGHFYNTESAPHNWWVNIWDFCSFASHIAQTLIWITDLSQGWFLFLHSFFLDSEWILNSLLAESLGAACMNPSSRDLPALLVFIFSHVIRLIYTQDVRRKLLSSQ